MNREDLSFVNAGRTAYLGVVENEVVGVLYWTEDEEDSRETGDLDGTFIWCWVSISSPFNHHGLTAPPLRRGMTQEQIEANASVAKEDTYRLLSGSDVGS